MMTLAEYIQKYPELGSRTLALKIFSETKLFLKLDSARTAIRRAREKLEPQGRNSSVHIDTKGDDMYIFSPRITSLDQLIKQCKIDLTIWDIDRHVVNKWEVGVKDETGKIITEPLYQVKCWLKKKAAPVLNLITQKAAIIAELKAGDYNKPFEVIDSPDPEEGVMLMINIFDLHFGKLAWHEESENYDYKIATSHFKSALADLAKKASGFKIEKILFPVGNDFFNSDTAFPFPATTAGTPQSDDIRWQQLFREGRKIIIEGINYLSQIAPVEVITVPGNHDFARTFYLGDLLEVVYENSTRVKIDNSPKNRKYFQYGKNLIGLTHGNEEKYADLALIMATEQPHLWADTNFRTWFLGHLHTAKTISYKATEEVKGVTIRNMRSMSGTDAWHHKKGYVGNIGGADAFIFDKSEGMLCNLIHNLKICQSN